MKASRGGKQPERYYYRRFHSSGMLHFHHWGELFKVFILRVKQSKKCSGVE
jgi:hypothetical protein